ncbi:hypothetical protein Tdes44962_MAKER01313 [Teratosphaeria destructans]|uniref:Uncharacterized protein n=1 Tax=Teratosphaeria destructans TaxID=418781 RepID=A0A9W7T1B6_9PEZI|nr:hypothetical protein Tdes44962_MAKER01313 [Teratosphaeria destructans]
MAKRKRKQQQGGISDTKKQKLSSSFLALPAEVRDHIYSFCAIMDSARITPKTKGELIGASPLLSVNKQVRQEYKGALYREAPITARVVDFNFAHVVKFLNRLSDSELKARTPTTFRGSNMDRDGCQPRAPTPSSVRKSKGKMTLRTPSEPTFEVLLLLTRGCQPNPEGLQRWLLRLENPLKKGSQISMSYRVAPRAHHLKLEACRIVRAVGAHSSLCNTLDEIIRVLTGKIRRVEELEQGKLWREMKKVQRALWRGRPQMLKSGRV